MTFYNVKSHEDLEKLKQLSELNKQISNQRIEDKVQEITHDLKLAKQLSPITKPIVQKLEEQTRELKNQNENFTQLSNNLMLMDTLKKLPDNISIDVNVIKGLHKLLDSNNKELKLRHEKDNKFTLGKTPIELVRSHMIIDGNSIRLNDNVINALTMTDFDLSNLNDNEILNFYEILNRINYSFRTNPDRTSKRSRYIRTKLEDRVKAINNPQLMIEPLEDDEDFQSSHKANEELRSSRETNEVEGSGVIFLPSDANELFERLIILIGEKKAGNNNVLTEGSAILDELLRQDVVNEGQYQQLIKLL